MNEQEILEKVPARHMVGQLVRLSRLSSHVHRTKDYARVIRVSPSTVQAYERSEICPSGRVRERIAAASSGMVSLASLDTAAHSFSLTYDKMRERAREIRQDAEDATEVLSAIEQQLGRVRVNLVDDGEGEEISPALEDRLTDMVHQKLRDMGLGR